MKLLSQRARLAILIAYLALLFGASKAALGTWLPPTSEKGLWFYSGFAAILLGNLLVTPFFTKPVDAISNAVAAIIGLLAVNILGASQYSGFDRFLWLLAVGFAVVVLIAGILAIVMKDSVRPTGQRWARTMMIIADALGGPRVIFSVVFLFALVAFHRGTFREYFVLSLVWVLLIGLQPLETGVNLFKRSLAVWRTSSGWGPFADIVGYHSPNIILLRHQQDALIPMGSMLIVQAEDGKLGLALALDHIGFAEGLWLRACQLSITPAVRDLLEHRAGLRQSHRAAVVPMPEPEWGNKITDHVWTARNDLIGLVAAGTDLTRLRFEVIRTDVELGEGYLVEVEIASARVLYQIVNGLTREEILQQRSSRGYVHADAKKVGRWNKDKGGFEVVKWIPQPNTPVFLVNSCSADSEPDAVGYLPRTAYPVTLNLDLLVTHNAAILGILGVGKSFLAYELVERMIRSGIKVICVDLTDRYAVELDRFRDADCDQADDAALQTKGRSGKTLCKQNVEEGGSTQLFRAELNVRVKSFLESESPTRQLRVFNPSHYEVWRQDSKPFNNQASMVMLTPTEITRLITEAVLDAMQAKGVSEKGAMLPGIRRSPLFDTRMDSGGERRRQKCYKRDGQGHTPGEEVRAGMSRNNPENSECDKDRAESMQYDFRSAGIRCYGGRIYEELLWRRLRRRTLYA